MKQWRIPSFSQQQLTNSGSVVVTSSRIAAASARALPARAAHLSGWTHRLRPTAIRAAPATSTAHSTPLSVYLTRSQVPRCLFMDAIADLSHARASGLQEDLRLDRSSLFPHTRDSGLGTRDQRLGSSSASDNALCLSHTFHVSHLSLISPNPGNTICCISFDPFPLTTSSPSFHLRLGGSSAYIPCSLKIRSYICKDYLRDVPSV